jgi:K+-sensing histidine kinase KdpD
LITGVGALCLLAVLFAAIYRGQIAGIATAVLGFIVLNFFFVAPRHELRIRRLNRPWPS